MLDVFSQNFGSNSSKVRPFSLRKLKSAFTPLFVSKPVMQVLINKYELWKVRDINNGFSHCDFTHKLKNKTFKCLKELQSNHIVIQDVLPLRDILQQEIIYFRTASPQWLRPPGWSSLQYRGHFSSPAPHPAPRAGRYGISYQFYTGIYPCAPNVRKYNPEHLLFKELALWADSF